MAPRKLSRWPFVAVVACLFLSGAASLVLELVWSRLLKLVFGSTTLAVSTILIAYMLGLGLGGLLGGRVAHRLRNGVRAYGLFEVGLGAYALAVPFLLQQFPAIDRAGLTGLGFWPAALVRFVLALLLLLLPTILMGATLPVLVAALARGGSGLGSRAGLLYGINTMGAVGGTLLATFVLFPRVGLAATNLAGAILDLLAGLVALAWLARSFQAAGRPSASAKQARVVRAARPGRWNLLLVSYALVGFTALVYEIGWTRVLAMVLGSSIYAFATMLVAFLAGIALGSLLFRRRADRLARPLAAYALGVALLGGVAFAAGLVFGNLPDLFLALMAWTGPGRVFQVLVQLGVAGVVMLAPTLVLGALFPLVARAAGAGRTDGGRVVGDVYFANTMGSAAGAFAAGFVLIPLAGLRVALAGAVGLNLATAAILLARQRQWTGSGMRLAAGLLGVSAVAMVLFPPAWNERSLTRGLYYHPSKMMTFSLPLHRYEGMPDPEEEEILFYRDGLNTTVSVHRDLAGLDLLLNGKADASLGDMSTQVLLGQIPMLFGGPVERALVIGYASGVTTGAVALHEPERVDVVDIEPAVFQASHFFDDFNHHPLDDPRVHVIIDDGRTYLAATGARYDVIVSEPSNPWIAGCSNLFTREFFQIARQALRPGGRLLQWIPIYDMDRTVLQAILRGLQAEFPYVYGFLESVDEVDLLILATDRELSLADLPDWPGLPEAVRDDLRRIGIFSSAQLWSLMRLTAEDIGKMTRGAGPVNSDDNMYVELHLPWTRNRFPLREWDVLGRFTEGAGGMDGPGSPPLTPDELGALALSYLEERHDPRVAETLLRRARPGEECALCLTAVAALAGQMAGAPGEADAVPGERIAAMLDRAVSLAPDRFEPHYARAQRRFSAKDHAGALQDLDAALDIRPLDYRAQHLRLVTLGALGRARAAREDAEFLLARNLGQYEWQWRLWADAGVAAAALGQFEQAGRELRAYLARQPLAVREWQMLAGIYRRQGEKEKAGQASRNAQTAFLNRILKDHREARRLEFLDAGEQASNLLRDLVARYPGYAPARQDLERLTLPGAR